MVVFDTTTLLIVIAPPELVKARANGKLIPDARQRIDHLLVTLEQAKTKVLIPTPALSEAVVWAGREAAQAYVDRINKAAAFGIVEFDAPAAVEAAAMLHEARRAGDKRGGASGEWQKIKVDRQIVAIAKVRGAKTIYSNDEDVETLGRGAGLEVVGIQDLPLPEPPPPPAQSTIFDVMEKRRAEETP